MEELKICIHFNGIKIEDLEEIVELVKRFKNRRVWKTDRFIIKLIRENEIVIVRNKETPGFEL